MQAVVVGRAKNFYSAYKKMLNKGISFDEIRDMAAIRIIAESPDDCYRVLGIMHQQWKIPKHWNVF